MGNKPLCVKTVRCALIVALEEASPDGHIGVRHYPRLGQSIDGTFNLYKVARILCRKLELLECYERAKD